MDKTKHTEELTPRNVIPQKQEEISEAEAHDNEVGQDVAYLLNLVRKTYTLDDVKSVWVPRSLSMQDIQDVLVFFRKDYPKSRWWYDREHSKYEIKWCPSEEQTSTVDYDKTKHGMELWRKALSNAQENTVDEQTKLMFKWHLATLIIEMRDVELISKSDAMLCQIKLDNFIREKNYD